MLDTVCLSACSQPSRYHISRRSGKVRETAPARIIDRLIKRLQRIKPMDRNRLAEDFFNKHPRLRSPLLKNGTITFFYKGVQAQRLFLRGEFDRRPWRRRLLRTVQGSGLYYLSLKIDGGGRRGFAYYFQEESDDGHRSFRDPRNPDIAFKRRKKVVSFLTLPGYRGGRISIAHPGLPSGMRQVGTRPIYIYLPPGYHQEPGKQYPVLYMHDGKNFWHRHFSRRPGWDVDKTTTRMIRENKIRKIIIVGIPHSGRERLLEYSPPYICDTLSRRFHMERKGYGDKYYLYLKNSVKPMIDTKYRTLPGRQHTAVAGSSMGGIISFYLAYTYPSLFSKAGIISPAFYLEYRIDNKSAELQQLIKQKKDILFYMDSGTAGRMQDGLYYTRKMKTSMLKAGWNLNKDLIYFEHKGGRHNKRSWRTRFHRLLKAFFPKK